MRSADKKMKEVQLLKLMATILYVRGSQLQLIKYDEILMPVCENAQKPASHPDWWNF